MPYNDRLPWIPHALLAAERIAAAVPLRAVLSTSPPVAAHVAAYLFVRRHGCVGSRTCRIRSAATRAEAELGQALRSRDRARRVRAGRARGRGERCRGRAMAPQLAEAGRKFRTIWMGFDPAEGIGPSPVPVRERRVMLHIGFLYEERHPIALLESLERCSPAASSIRRGSCCDSAAAPICPRRCCSIRPAARWPRAAVSSSTTVTSRAPMRSRRPRCGLAAAARRQEPVRPELHGAGKLYDYVLTAAPILAVTDPGSPTQRILAGSGVGTRACSTAIRPKNAIASWPSS
jgi:hypothetical protein